MIKNNNKGAISLYALLTVMFFITFILGVYKVVSGNNNSQLSSIQYLQKQYYVSDTSLNAWFDKKKVSIGTYDELKELPNTGTWYVGTDIYVDINSYMCGKNWVSYDYKMFNSNLNTEGHKIIYLKDGKKYMLLAFQDIDKALFDRTAMNLQFSGGMLTSITDVHTEGAYSNINAIIGNKIDDRNVFYYNNSYGYEFLLMYPKGPNNTFNLAHDSKQFSADYYDTWYQKVTPLSRTYDLNVISKRDIVQNMTFTSGNEFQGMTIPYDDSQLTYCLFDGNIRLGNSYFNNWWHSVASFVRYDPVYLPGANQRVRMSAFFIRLAD